MHWIKRTIVMKELMILGAGTGGVVAASMMSHKLDLKK